MEKPCYTSSFPAKNHPNAASITSNVQKYFIENWPWHSEADKAKYLEMDIEGSATWTLPYVPEDRMETLTKWYTWGFLFDDILEIPGYKTREYFVNLVNVMLGQAPPDGNDKLLTITHDIHQGFVDVLDEPGQRIGHVLLELNQDWIKHHLKSMKERQGQPELVTVEEYITKRIAKAGVITVWLGVRWGLRVELPQSVLSHRLIRELTDVANEQCVLINDMYSYRKEMQAFRETGGGIFFDNVVAVIMRERGVTEPVALEHVYDRLHHLESEFLRLEELVYVEFDGQEKESLKAYLEGLKWCLSGIITWSSSSPRYDVATRSD